MARIPPPSTPENRQQFEDSLAKVGKLDPYRASIAELIRGGTAAASARRQPMSDCTDAYRGRRETAKERRP